MSWHPWRSCSGNMAPKRLAPGSLGGTSVLDEYERRDVLVLLYKADHGGLTPAQERRLRFLMSAENRSASSYEFDRLVHAGHVMLGAWTLFDVPIADVDERAAHAETHAAVG